MGDIARHNQAGLELNAAICSAIPNDSIALSPGLQKAVLFAGGDVYPTLGGTLTAAPTIQFQTRDIDLVQSPTQLTGSGAIVSCRAYADDGGQGAAYISIAIADGIIVPITLDAQMGQPAILTCQIVGISTDGDAAPVAVGTTEKALAVHGDSHTLGVLNIGGAIVGLQSASLQFGYQVKTNEGENGKTYPTLAYWDRQNAILTGRNTQLSAATAQRLTTGQSTTSVTQTFRKLQEGAVVTDTGQITATMAKAIIEAQNVNSGLPYTLDLVVTPIYDGGGNDYLTWS